MHGIFDNPQVVRYWLNRIGLKNIKISNLAGLEARNREYDLPAEHFERYVELESIIKLIS